MTAARQKILSLFGLVLLGGVASCNSPSVEEVCTEHLPPLLSSLDRGILALNETEDSNRAIASESSPQPRLILAESSREEWADWAKDRLEAVQEYMDVLEADPKMIQARQALSAVADELASFYALAEKGDPARMTQSLTRVREKLVSAQPGFCIQGRGELQSGRTRRYVKTLSLR